MPIKRLEGKEMLISTSKKDKGKWLEFEGNNYYVVRDNQDFSRILQLEQCFSSLITTYVSNMSRMYKYIWNLKTFNEPLNSWDVSKVENMSYMFHGCSFFNQPLDQWDVSKEKICDVCL